MKLTFTGFYYNQKQHYLLDIVVFFNALPVGRDKVIDVLDASIVASLRPEPRDTNCRPAAVVWATVVSTLTFF